MSIRCHLFALNDNEIQSAVNDARSLDSFLEGEYVMHHSLDQAWHAIHFLLTGDSWAGPEPLCFLLSGGDFIEEPEYMHASRGIKSKDVARLSAELAKINELDLRRRYAPDKMRAGDVWLFIGEPDPKAVDLLDYLLLHFLELRPFVDKAAENRLGIVVTYT